MKGWPQSWRHSRFVDDFAGGRRQAPRCEARLKVSLRFNPAPTEAGGAARARPAGEISGETLNLSETGLAVSLPSNHINDHYLDAAGSALSLVLELPEGPVRISAAPKWCRWFTEEEGTARSYLLGLRITEMTDEEWVRLVRYVHACL